MHSDPSNPGYKAEQLFYEHIKTARTFFKDIKHEDDLKKYGWDFTGIDYLLFTHNGMIPIQIKYKGTRRRENLGINNFLKSVKLLNQIYKEQILFGLWISRLKPFRDNEQLLTSYNIKCVDEFNDMNELMRKSVNCILSNI
jgi:hypothetical protein